MRDAILNRVSTRTFSNDELTTTDIDKIISLVKEHEIISGPFGNKFELTFNLNNKEKSKGKKIGTYGLLKNVPSFIGGICDNTPEAIVDFGYVFENLILSLTKQGYGTCWLGGTFKRKSYRKEIGENQLIPAISPVGYKAEKRSFIDRSIRSAAQSSNRKDDSLIFFDYNTLKELSDNTDIVIKQSLCLVKRAPSASNKQPWRMYVENNLIHFYVERTKGYAKPLKYDIQLLDMGIALNHFVIGVDYFKKKTTFEVKTDCKEIIDQEYIISIKID